MALTFSFGTVEAQGGVQDFRGTAKRRNVITITRGIRLDALVAMSIC
jgi:hypothetical protein